jgi:SHS2 domain-containing protein
MLDVVTETNQVEEANPRMEVVEVADDEDLGPTNGKQALRKEMTDTMINSSNCNWC